MSAPKKVEGGSSTRAAPKPTSGVSLSDQALVRAVQNGDGSAARVLYDRLYPVIDHTLRRVLRVRIGDFDDLVQVTFERIVRGIAHDRFAGRSALTTWAAAIAGHVAVDYLRRTVREQNMLRDLPPPSTFAAPELRMEARSEMRRVYGVLVRMQPKLVEAVLLFDVLGYNIEQLAELTGVSTSAAQSRLYRGRRELVRRAGSWKPRKP